MARSKSLPPVWRAALALALATLAALAAGTPVARADGPQASAEYTRVFVEDAVDQHHALSSLAAHARASVGMLTNGQPAAEATLQLQIVTLCWIGGGVTRLRSDGAFEPIVTLGFSLFDVDDVSVYSTVGFAIDPGGNRSAGVLFGGGISWPLLRDLFVDVESGYVVPDGVVSVRAGISFRFFYLGGM